MNMLYINAETREKKTVRLQDIIDKLKPLDRLIDIDETVSFFEMYRQLPENKKFTFFNRNGSRVYLFL